MKTQSFSQRSSSSRREIARLGRRRGGLGVAVLCAALGATACSSTGTQLQDGYPHAGARSRMNDYAAANAKPEQKLSFPELIRQGDQVRDQGDLGRATFHYLQALGARPDAAEPRERIAYMHLDAEPERARTIFEDLERRAPDAISPKIGLGLAHLALGRVELARRGLERALELGSKDLVAPAALGMIYDRLGDHGVAQGFHHAALSIRPNDPDLLNNLGTSQLMAGSFARAVETLREASRARPGDRAIRNNLALALGRTGAFEEARAIFEEADDTAAAENNLGYLYLLDKQYEKAIHHFERALLEGHPDRLTILRNLHAAQSALVKPKKAVRKAKAEPSVKPAPEPVVGEGLAEYGQSIDPSMWSPN